MWIKSHRQTKWKMFVFNWENVQITMFNHDLVSWECSSATFITKKNQLMQQFMLIFNKLIFQKWVVKKCVCFFSNLSPFLLANICIANEKLYWPEQKGSPSQIIVEIKNFRIIEFNCQQCPRVHWKWPEKRERERKKGAHT